MMFRFLRHIDQHLEWRGMKMLTYRYWHPTDTSSSKSLAGQDQAAAST